jgi:hypothetical protein
VPALDSLSGWRRAWTLPDRRPVYDWARDHVHLVGGYARQGAFDIRTCRHLMEPFHAVADEAVREITCRAAIQTLKTLFVEITSLWAIANEPGPIMWTQQDDDSAQEHVKGRYRNLLRSCEPVARLLPRNKHDAATCEIYFGDFYLIVNGANLNNLQSKSIRWKLNSECWLWKQGLLTHARRRVSAYARDGISKILNESQGSHADDDFDRLWLEGSAQEWSIQCAGCNRLQPLTFFGRAKDEPAKMACIIWDKDAKSDTGKWDEDRVRRSARWMCPDCGTEHANTPQTRAKWNAAGEYGPQRASADRKHRSYSWNALIAEDMGQLAVEFLQAGEFKKRGQIAPLRDFYMQRLALSWRNEQEMLQREQITLRGAFTLAEKHAAAGQKIDGESRRLFTIDRQRDHFWGIVRAWSVDGSSQLLWRGRVNTTEQIEEVRRHFAVEPQLTFQDAQFDTAHVYEDCVRYGWTALHGSGDDSFPTVKANGQKVYRFYSSIKQTQVPGGYARYMFWASDPVKDMLAALIAGTSHRWEVAADVGDDYQRHLRGEAKKERVSKATGRSEWRWHKTGPNHMWDCEAMQVAVALALQILPSIDKANDDTDKK